MPNDLNKKAKEKAILNLIYADEKYGEIITSEEPDFHICPKHDDSKFGIEITEFYFSNSCARINNIPGYVMDIINNGKYRHKDDIETLAVKNLILEPHDNRPCPREIKGIMQERPSIDKYLSKIAERINDKNNRFENYITGLSHVNLIIFDCENRLVGSDIENFHYNFFKPGIEKVLLESKFREVFLITELGSFKSPTCVYIPLKMLFLIAEVYLFNFIMGTKYKEEAKKLEENESVLFAQYLKWRGASKIKYKDVSDGYEIAYGNSGVLITRDNRVILRDYNDHRLPTGFELAEGNEFNSFFDERFKNIFNQLKNSYIFKSGLHFEVKRD